MYALIQPIVGLCKTYKRQTAIRKTKTWMCVNDSRMLLNSFKINIQNNIPFVKMVNIPIPTRTKSFVNYCELSNTSMEVSRNSSGVNDTSNYMPTDSGNDTNDAHAIKDNDSANDSDNVYDRVTKDLHVKNNYKTKKYFCYFCENMVTKIARHFENVHNKEEEVQTFVQLPKGSNERKKIIETIRRKGDYIYNTKQDVNKGDILVTRRPRENRSSRFYKCCPNCKGFFSKITLRRHYIKCINSPKKGDRNLYILSRKIQGLMHPKATETLRKEVFPILREDYVTRLLRYDELLILFGNKLCLKYKAKYHHKMIRARLRLLGRLLIELKNLNKNIINFASIYSPENYDNFIDVVNIIGELSHDKTKYNKPAGAANIGTLVKVVGRLFISECIKRQDKTSRKNAEQFLEILSEDYGTSVNKTVCESQAELKRRKTILLPTMSDIKIFNNYINSHRIKAYRQLKNSITYQNWKTLGSYTLVGLQLFNRRRAGELERMQLLDFNNFQSVDKDNNADLYKILTEDDKKAAQKYVRVVIRGKLNRVVPVLIGLDEFKCIQLILKYRKEMGVPSSNIYVFGLPSTDKSKLKHLEACELMRKFAHKSGAKFPERLRGTQLRKHIATRSAVLNFNETEVSELANFLGHADKIHKELYRVPLVTRDITRMSKVLEQAKGDSSDFLSDTQNTSIEDTQTSLGFADCD